MKKLPSLLKDIRLKKPLIHHMTNQVTMNLWLMEFSLQEEAQ